MRIEFTFLFYGIYAVYQRCTVNPLKKKRSLNGNPTRRPPARLIALYKVFKVSLKPFQRLVGFGATPREKNSCVTVWAMQRRIQAPIIYIISEVLTLINSYVNIISISKHLCKGGSKGMTLRHLTIFKCVCDKMSITGAAEKLNMTQPAVSIAIKELEAFYCAKLFDRINRRIYLTQAGEILRQYADTILSRFDESISVIRDESNIMTCRMGVNVAVGEEFLSDILKMLKSKMPELTPSVIIDNADTIEKKLVENGIDFAITDTLHDTANRSVSRIYSEEMQIICSYKFFSGKSITIEELSKQPLLLREKGSGCRDCIESVFSANDCEVVPLAESTSTLSLINMAKNDLGMAILPKTLIAHMKENSILHTVEVPNCRFERHHYIAYLSNKYMSLAIRQSIEEIKSFFDSIQNSSIQS